MGSEMKTDAQLRNEKDSNRLAAAGTNGSTSTVRQPQLPRSPTYVPRHRVQSPMIGWTSVYELQSSQLG
jgi:hypothetical protein